MARPSRVLRQNLTISAALSVLATLPLIRAAEFKFPGQTLRVPDGFTVELVAAPPAVNRPISIAFDDRGRLYATDSSGLSDRAPAQFEQKPHRIVRLEDTTGDGRFDRSTVFAENMMFPQGALFHEGSLYVAAPPHIWKLTDTNGDGVADERTVWWDGKTLTGCANDVHGPTLGPDGWFYWTKGAFAEQTHTLGTGKQFISRASHIYRARPDGTGLEPVLTGGMDNPVGLAFSESGERFLTGTFFQLPAAGKRDGLIHAIYGGTYGKENATLAGHARTGDLMPIMTHMGAAAPCGATEYRSAAFGRDFTGNLFVCYFNLRKIVRHELVPDGATFRTRDTDFVTSDSQDFRPTDVLEDADGSMLIADTGGWYKICCPTSQLSKPDVLGAIYRIRKTGAPKVSDPRGEQMPWTTMTPDNLAALLSDARPEVVQRAQQTLGKMGAEAVAAVVRRSLDSSSPAVRRNALWALARIDVPASRAAVRNALGDGDESVARTALSIVSLWRDSAARDQLATLVTGKTPALVRPAAEILGRIGDHTSVKNILAAAEGLGATAFTATGTPESQAERALEHSLIYALIEIGRGDELSAELKRTNNPRRVRVALVALDQMQSGGLKPELVIPFLNFHVSQLRQTAAWIVGHRPEWGGQLADFFRGRLAIRTASESARAELQTQLAALAKDTAIQELLVATATGDGNSNARLTALRAMAGAGLKETPVAWFAALASVLSKGDAESVRQAVATARTLPLPKAGHPEFSAALARVGRDSTNPADVRVDALAITPGTLGQVEPELFAFLQAHLDGRQPMLVRSAAANALAKAPLSASQQLALAETMQQVGALEAPKLLPAFERNPGEALGLKLVAALRASPGIGGVRPGHLRPLLAKFSATVQREGDALIASINADAARQSARVDELLAKSPGGDIRRGQTVFNEAKNACTLCHKIGYGGGLLGPDLTNIGRIRTERDLLEAIVFPSATLVRGYEPFTVTTRGGATHSGIVRKDTPDEVILATGPDTEAHLARADILDMQPATVSPMPPGMDAVLTPRELADLVAFLKSRQ